jgi:hypothetical protein
VPRLESDIIWKEHCTQIILNKEKARQEENRRMTILVQRGIEFRLHCGIAHVEAPEHKIIHGHLEQERQPEKKERVTLQQGKRSNKKRFAERWSSQAKLKKTTPRRIK